MLSSLQDAAAVIAQTYAPRSTGGVGFGFLVVTMIAVSTAALLKKPGASRLCLWSALVVCLNWLGTSLVKATISGMDHVPSWMLSVSVLIIVIYLVAIILAISGLVVWSHAKGRYLQGKGHAITAIIVSSLFIFIQVRGLVALGPQGLAALAAASGSTAPGARFLNLKDYPELNFSFANPDAPWTPGPADKAPEGCTFFHMRVGVPAYLAAIVEPNPDGADAVHIGQILMAHLKTVAKTTEELPTAITTIRGLDFHRFPAKCSGIAGVFRDIHYEYWVACTPSFAYQFTFWSAWSDRASAVADAEAWMNSFRLLSAEKNVAAQTPCRDGEFPAQGFALRGLAKAGWLNNHSPVLADSEVSLIKTSNGISLKCYPLPGNVKVRPAELDAILLATRDVTDKEKADGPTAINKDGIEGRLYEFDRKIDSFDYHFKIRIFQQPTLAHLLVTWGFKKTPERERNEAAAMIHLSAPDANAPAPALTDEGKKSQAFFNNDLGIAHYRRQDYRDAAALFRAAFQLRPTDDSIAGNLVDATEMQGKAAEALDIIAKELSGPLRKNVKILARQALLQTRTGNADAALNTWKTLFDDDYQNDDHLLSWINLLLEKDKPADALKAVETYARHYPSKKIDRWTASVLARTDRFDDAFKKLDPQISATPPDVDALYLYGELKNDAGRYEDAEKIADRLQSAGEDTARTEVLRGWSQWHRKAWKAAHESFTKAAAKSPEDTTIKEALAMTAGALGQGGAEWSKTPLEPVAIPKPLAAALAALPELPVDLSKGHGAQYLERVTGIFYQSGKPVRVTQYYKVKIHDQSGLESFSTMSQAFEPASEKVYVNRLIVKDETGKIIQEGSNADAYATGENGDLATGGQIMRIPVPGLRRGCTLEVAITVEDKSKSTEPPFRRDLFVSGFPATARAWFVQGDTAAMRFLPKNGLKPLDGEGFKAYLIAGTRAWQRETLSVPLEDWHPVIVAGPANDHWKELSADYLKRLKDRLEPDESTIALAEKLCKNLKTPEEKLGAIIRHVQSTLTYKGLEFGPRGQIPSPVAKILGDQYGDCKDHTFLLYHLLRRAGIACSPALVDTDWRLRRDLPSLDQFNHMILHVPGVGSQPWIDATDDWLDLAHYVPENLGGRDALVLDPAGAHLETIPETPATLIKIDRTAKLVSPSGSVLAVDETLTLTGSAASWARGWFLSAAESEYINMVRRQLDAHGSFDLSRVELEHAQDQSLPLIVHLTYTVPDAYSTSTRQLSVPFFWERDYLAISPGENRQSGFRLQPAMRIESTFRLTAPPGSPATPVLAPGHPAAAAAPASGTLTEGKWELTSAPDGADWLVTLKTDSRAGDFPVTDWSAFQQSRRTLTERLKRHSLTLP